MKVAVYTGKEEPDGGGRVAGLLAKLKDAGVSLYDVTACRTLEEDTDMLMSVGGDGTFLTASMLVAQSGVPVVGVNLGRLGFLSENRPEDVADALLAAAQQRATILAQSLNGLFGYVACRGRHLILMLWCGWCCSSHASTPDLCICHPHHSAQICIESAMAHISCRAYYTRYRYAYPHRKS